MSAMMSRPTLIALLVVLGCILLTSCGALPFMGQSKDTADKVIDEKTHSVQQAAAHMADRAREAAYRASDHVHEAAADAQDAAVTAADRAGEELSAAAERAGEQATQMKEHAKQNAAETVEHTKQAMENAKDAVQETADETAETAEKAAHSVGHTVGHGLSKAGHVIAKGAHTAVEAVLRTVPEDEQVHAREVEAGNTGLAGMAVKFSKIMTRGKTMHDSADEGNQAANVEKKQEAAARQK